MNSFSQPHTHTHTHKERPGKTHGILRKFQGEPHKHTGTLKKLLRASHTGTQEGPRRPQGMLRQLEESLIHTGRPRTPSGRSSETWT
jgi:hypothetical protein